MYRFWALLAKYTNKMANKSARGKAICNQFDSSARKTAFDFFGRGYRPSQLPDLGVKKATLYKYFQVWKHRTQEFGWRFFKELLTTNQPSRIRAANLIGVSEDTLGHALKNCRSSAQLKKRLGLGKVELIDRLIAGHMRLYLDRVIIRLSKYKSTDDRLKELRVIATSMGISAGELLLMLNQLHIDNKTREESQNQILLKQLLWTLKKMKNDSKS